ncbi:hypothetical protein AAKU55_003392 [Oxalobacteraceae bacterium GrIS 1.11]
MMSKDGWDWRLVGRLLVGGALLAAATMAQAQYVWLDNKGLRQYSDRPPPPSVPLKSILKAPGGVPAAEPAAADGAEPDATPAAASAPTLAERNADFRKRKTEDAEKQKKAADVAKRQADNASNCDSLRQNKALLDSGRRISNTDKATGEAGYMTDEARAQQSQKVQRALADCK